MDENSESEKSVDLHLHPLDLDSPRVRGLVEGLLHDVADGLALGQDLGQVLGPQHVPQCRRRQQVRGVAKKGEAKIRAGSTIFLKRIFNSNKLKFFDKFNLFAS